MIGVVRYLLQEVEQLVPGDEPEDVLAGPGEFVDELSLVAGNEVIRLAFELVDDVGFRPTRASDKRGSASIMTSFSTCTSMSAMSFMSSSASGLSWKVGFVGFDVQRDLAHAVDDVVESIGEAHRIGNVEAHDERVVEQLMDIGDDRRPDARRR